MKKVAVVFEVVLAAIILIGSSSVSHLDMTVPGAENTSFNFKYTGTVNTGNEVMPLVGQLSKDGLNMYLTSQNYKGEKQLYIMSREKVGDAFGKPEKLRGTINSADYDIIMPTVSGDEKTMVFVSSADGTQKGNDLYISTKDEQQDNDLYITSRVGGDGPFVNVRALDEINDKLSSDSYPWLSIDGLRLYFTKQKGSEITFHYAERSDLSSRFGNMKKLDLQIPKISNNMSCFLSEDETEIFTLTDDKIYHAKRESWNSKFSVPVEIGKSNNEGYMSGITMSPDQSELFVFNSVGFRNTQILRFVNTEVGKKDKTKVTASDNRNIEVR